MGDDMTLKNRLRKVRHEMMIDRQTEMAELLGITKYQYNRYEKQHSQPTLESALIMASKINRKVEDLFYIDPD